MLKWALIFLVIGLIAGLLGFTGIAGTSIAIAKTLFFIFLVIFLVLLVAGLHRGKARSDDGRSQGRCAAHFLAAFVLVPAAALAACSAGLFSSSSPAAAQARYPPSRRAPVTTAAAPWMDTNLRIDQVQVVGTAQSYKQRPDKALMGLIRMGGKKDAEALDFGHARHRGAARR